MFPGAQFPWDADNKPGHREKANCMATILCIDDACRESKQSLAESMASAAT